MGRRVGLWVQAWVVLAAGFVLSASAAPGSAPAQSSAPPAAHVYDLNAVRFEKTEAEKASLFLSRPPSLPPSSTQPNPTLLLLFYVVSAFILPPLDFLLDRL
jgi:hypothetical protein